MVKGDYQDRARGMLVGLAVGDALGAPYEFGYTSELIKERGDEISHLHSSMILPAGAWTDDTSMALCLADSLLEKDGYDSYDVMDKFRKWVVFGYRSFDGKPAFDVGTQTANAVGRFHRYPVIAKNEPKTESAGNGAIMRLAPIVLAAISPDKQYDELKNNDGVSKDIKSRYRERKIKDLDLTNLTELAVLSCRETHNSFAAEIVTEMFSIALFTAMYAEEKSDVRFFADKCCYLESQGYDEFRIYHNHLLIDRAYNADPEELCDLGGYIVDAFAIALWGFLHSETFKDGMIKVIQLGGDTDTNAACYGQLAGAYYGYESIPKEWRDKVQASEELVGLADRLFKMKKCPILKTRFEDNDYFVAPDGDYEAYKPELTEEPKKENNTKQLKKSDNIQSFGELLRERFGKTDEKSKK